MGNPWNSNFVGARAIAGRPFPQTLFLKSLFDVNTFLPPFASRVPGTGVRLRTVLWHSSGPPSPFLWIFDFFPVGSIRLDETPLLFRVCHPQQVLLSGGPLHGSLFPINRNLSPLLFAFGCTWSTCHCSSSFAESKGTVLSLLHMFPLFFLARLVFFLRSHQPCWGR